MEPDSAQQAHPNPFHSNPAHPDPSGLRVDYGDLTRTGLAESDLAPTPLAQWQRWWDEVAASASAPCPTLTPPSLTSPSLTSPSPARIAEPNAVILATVDAAGLPDARTVLLKGVDARGFVVYTNLTSAKGQQLAAMPAAALVAPWHPIGRQVRVRAAVEQVSRAESAAYFATRPWGSKIGAWASAQSAPTGSRDDLQRAFDVYAARWPADGSAGDVPLPDHWGGYLLRPREVEFWVGRTSRLHDRLVYVVRDPRREGTPPLDAAAAWCVQRRQP